MIPCFYFNNANQDETFMNFENAKMAQDISENEH